MVDSLAGRLLVAAPSTGGEIFRRSVVLLLHHDEAGAHGLVLNKPIPAPVSRVLPAWQEHVSEPAQLFQGGPVGLDTALGLVTVPGESAHSREDPAAREPLGIRLLFGSVGVVDLDTPPEVVVAAVAGMRVFAGYSGWGAGQLEGELEQGGWYVVAPEVGDAFTDDPAGLWERVLRRQRGHLAWVATYPDDPALN